MYQIRMRPYHFNPRSRVGSDRMLDAEVIVRVQFQSTLPRGERRDSIFPVAMYF